MSIWTLAKYLAGRREAILRIVGDPRSLGIGFCFVMSAALAREYDGHDLLHEPWHLLVPLVASIGLSFVLFALIRFGLNASSRSRPFWADYGAFLALFWMTAPLAWFYAIPYERFLSAGDATRANLITLGAVSLWRVLLMSRVISVITGRGIGAALFVVMAVADPVAMAALFVLPVPIIQIMGGVRLTESELIVQNVAGMVGFLGWITMLVWLIGAGVVLQGRKRAWNPGSMPTGSARSLRALAIASVLGFVAILPFSQGQQVTRYEAEKLLLGGRVREGIAFMSAHTPGDFPPHWEPPPDEALGHYQPAMIEVLDAVVNLPAADWVREIYLQKLERYSFGSHYYTMSAPDRAKAREIIPRLTDHPKLIDELTGRMHYWDDRIDAEFITSPENPAQGTATMPATAPSTAASDASPERTHIRNNPDTKSP